MQALLLEQQDGKTLASVQTLDESRLPEGDVTVDVHWSSLNYKDALAITGKGKIIRNFPMIPRDRFCRNCTHQRRSAFSCRSGGITHWLGRW